MKSMIDIKALKYNKDGLIVAVVQDITTGDVLMQAYMNEQAIKDTLDSGFMNYYSRSRNSQWKKGETSGHTQEVVELYYDCDKDCILAKVIQKGAACHTGNKSCFFTKLAEGEIAPDYSIVNSVYKTIIDRKNNPVEGSYTNYLFAKGTDKICKKIGEEATESVIAAKNKDKQELTMELSDLLYHSLVLMANEGITPEDIFSELMKREGRAPHPKYKLDK